MIRYDVVALGEPMIEFNQTRAADAASWRQGYGGDTSNMAIAAARLGARVAYVTRVGDDAFGRRLLSLWRDEGVAVDGVATDITYRLGGERASVVRAGARKRCFNRRVTVEDRRPADLDGPRPERQDRAGRW